MNREIKFRGKRIKTGEWVYGYYVKTPEGGHRIYLQPFSSASQNTWFYVDPATIGQYTGCKDLDGNEIYEGDIVTIESIHMIPQAGFKGEVKWMESGFYVDNGQEAHPVWSDAYTLSIIGNIHDKPTEQ